ncbi:hypothetical protein [Massilia sp. LjRoot122]|uniref:hypothetical protein n=1 Tax=Massilia sp. LjRoot122 TaxID=3342257 RepID=UPI003ECD66FA
MASKYASGISYSTIEIIDCLIPGKDAQTGRALHEHLRDIIPGPAPRLQRHCIGSEAEFWSQLDRIEEDCINGYKALIHIEAHAGKCGVEVGLAGSPGAAIIPWEALVDRFRDINLASGFNLGVFIAACEGFEALRHLTIKKPAPYMYLVGPASPVEAGLLESAARAFYTVIIKAPDLDRAFDTLPADFGSFKAEHFFANTYARLLKAQSFGKRRLKRIDDLVNKALPEEEAEPERLKRVRAAAKDFSKPDRDRFEAAQRVFLPRGLSFDFDYLVEYARTGKRPS